MPKGSKTTHKKKSMLGQFLRNNKLLNNMEIKINELVGDRAKNKQLRFNQKIKGSWRNWYQA